MSAPEEFQAAIVQFDVVAGDVEANVKAAVEGIEAAAAGGARMCVLPELWSTSFLSHFGDGIVERARQADTTLRELSEEHSMVLVGSAIEAADGGVYNTARVYQRGEELGSYRKVHMFSPNLEHRHHQSGSEPCVVDTELGRLGVLICYDIRFPELARYYFHAGAEILVVPGQWPEARSRHWRALLRARAIENEVFVIGCNRTGQEASLRTDEPMSFPGDGRIVDPTGEILATGTGDKVAVLAPIEVRKVRTMRRMLPVAVDMRPEVYRNLFEASYEKMLEGVRKVDPTAQQPASGGASPEGPSPPESGKTQPPSGS
ncbi:MAG: nitrilase-related carbon-nitrogen hydrolase [Planctomycetota bacterium]